MRNAIIIILCALFCHGEELKGLTKDEVTKHAIEMAVSFGFDEKLVREEMVKNSPDLFYGTTYLDETIEKEYLKRRIAERFRVANHYAGRLPHVLARAKDKFENDMEKCSFLDLIVLDRLFTGIDRKFCEPIRDSAQQVDAPDPGSNAVPASR